MLDHLLRNEPGVCDAVRADCFLIAKALDDRLYNVPQDLIGTLSNVSAFPPDGRNYETPLSGLLVATFL
jgi:hypothetical protein